MLHKVSECTMYARGLDAYLPPSLPMFDDVELVSRELSALDKIYKYGVYFADRCVLVEL